MNQGIIFYIIVLSTILVLILAIGNYQIISASTTTTGSHHGNKKDKENSNTHVNNKNKGYKHSTFSLPFNSNFADQSMKINKGKNDIIPFP